MSGSGRGVLWWRVQLESRRGSHLGYDSARRQRPSIFTMQWLHRELRCTRPFLQPGIQEEEVQLAGLLVHVPRLLIGNGKCIPARSTTSLNPSLPSVPMQPGV